MSKTKFNKLLIISALLANILEFYELTVFGFLAPLILTKACENYSFGSKIMGFGMFAIALFFRPLGAVIFGHIGDKYGRKLSLYISIVLMGFSTFLIGCLPIESYFLFLLIALIVLRSLQGISIGGEFSGSLIFILENSPMGRANTLACLLGAGVSVGVLLGNGVTYLVTNSDDPTWNWRYAFWAGLVLAAIATWIRIKLHDPYAEQVKRIPVRKSPLLEIIKANPLAILSCIAITALSGTLYYWVVFLTSIGDNAIKFPIAPILNMLFLPLAGLLADRIGYSRLMSVGLMITVPTLCINMLPGISDKIDNLLLIAVLVIGATLFQGPMYVLVFNLFQQRMRYSGVAVSFAIGMGAIGGLAPFLAQATYEIFANHIFINCYTILLSLFAMFFIFKIKGGASERTNQEFLEQPA